MTDSLAEDWIALWQSEMAAMAADRELRESWTGLLVLWSAAAASAVQILSRQAPDGQWGTPSGAAGAAQPPGTAPFAAAPDLGGNASRRLYAKLNERVAELESRLAAFERQSGRRPSGVRPSGPRDD